MKAIVDSTAVLIEELRRREAERLELLYSVAVTLARGEDVTVKVAEAAMREAGSSVADFEELLTTARNRLEWAKSDRYSQELMRTCPRMRERENYQQVARQLQQARARLTSLRDDAALLQQAAILDREARRVKELDDFDCQEKIGTLKTRAAEARKVADKAAAELPDVESVVAELEVKEQAARLALLDP
jgi:hypothetical protein